MEKVLLTGANGFVGQELVTVLLRKGYSVIATGKGPSRLQVEDPQLVYYDIDITHPFALQTVMIRELPSVIVHAAAMTQVDECEQRQNEAHALNVEATARLLLDAETYSNFIIFLSTDFVFDGEKGMYEESDDVNPVSWYGHTKVEAEAVMQTSAIPWAIVRTCLVYGNQSTGGRHNIFSWVRESLEAGKHIKVVDDQWRTPTYVTDLAEGIAAIIDAKAEGIWHLSGKDRMTPYRMAMEIAAYNNYNSSLVEKVTAANFSQPGKRPRLTGFNISKAENELGYVPLSFGEAMKRLMG